MLKVMLIDPWGSDENSYFTGLVETLSVKTELTVVAKKNFINNEKIINKVIPTFHHNKDRKGSKTSRIIKGINYIASYLKIINELKKQSYDVVHIQWLLMYKIDKFFLRIIRKYCEKIVYTAHNVLPHMNGDKYHDDLRDIYGLVDKIVLHGIGVRDEFRMFFKEYDNKVIIQRHGTYLNQIIDYDINKIETDIVQRMIGYEKIFIFTGIMFYNKGVDRLIKIWLDEFSNSNNLLIIAGQKKANYDELDKLEGEIKNCENILYINSYVEPNLFSYLMTQADIVILPYRHASMSGVVFTAAEFKKPVLCTKTGSLAEYLIDKENSFVITIDDEVLSSKIKYISENISKESLTYMGDQLNIHINENYSWGAIGKKLINECYEA